MFVQTETFSSPCRYHRAPLASFVRVPAPSRNCKHGPARGSLARPAREPRVPRYRTRGLWQRSVACEQLHPRRQWPHRTAADADGQRRRCLLCGLWRQPQVQSLDVLRREQLQSLRGCCEDRARRRLRFECACRWAVTFPSLAPLALGPSATVWPAMHRLPEHVSATVPLCNVYQIGGKWGSVER